VVITTVHHTHQSPDSNLPDLPEASDFVGTLLRDPTSSHLLEEIVVRCPDSAYGILWQLYFKGSFARLGIHPVANFVASKAIERCSAEQLADVASEMESAWIKNIRTYIWAVVAIIDLTGIKEPRELECCERLWTGRQH
jgi:nucleolar protein 9